MKYFLALMIFSFSLAGFTQESDGCVFNWAEFKSHLDVNHHTVKIKTDVKRNEQAKILTQSVTLEDGTEIEFKGGGCAHIAYSFTYKGFKQTYKTTKELMYLALSLLTETPTQRPEAVLLNSLTIRNVSKVIKESRGRYKLPCGSATCYIDASEKGQLTISYDFAL